MDRVGLDVLVPYYFNLAPNYDLTLTPRSMALRGLQLNTEFRYLRTKPAAPASSSSTTCTEIETRGIPRHRLKFNHRSRFAERWQSDDRSREHLRRSVFRRPRHQSTYWRARRI